MAQAHVLKQRMSAGERREAILDAALPLFAQEGYERASINDIVATISVTKPVIYDHFASKRDLYLAVLERENNLLLADLLKGFDANAPLDERLRHLAGATIRFVRQRPDAARIAFRTPEGDDITRAEHQRLRAVRHGLATQLILADPAFAASRGLSRKASAALQADLQGAVLERLALWALEHPATSASALGDVFVDLLWNGLGH